MSCIHPLTVTVALDPFSCSSPQFHNIVNFTTGQSNTYDIVFIDSDRLA